MKKFFYCFILFVVFYYNRGFTSSHIITKENRDLASKTDPSIFVKKSFELIGKSNDFSNKKTIENFSEAIINTAYSNNPKFKLKSVYVLAACAQEQTINGRKKYNENDIQQIIKISKKYLGLK